jgi:hypothetical protein
LRYFPPPAFLIPLVIRAINVWAGIRVLLALGIAMLDAGPFELPASVASGVAMVAGTLSWLDARRRREHLLLGNLGVSQLALFLSGLIPAVVLELLLAVAWHVSA